MIVAAGARLPFATASTMITELSGITLGTKRIERSAEADGSAARDRQRAEAAASNLTALINPCDPQPPAGGDKPDTMYIAIDGTGVPMVAAAVADRAGKDPDTGARTREVKLAAIFTQTNLDEHGRPVRDTESTSYVGSFDPASRFGPLVAAEARRRGADHIRQQVVLGDGAVWIWKLATKHWPAATPIVDIYHARQHLHALADRLQPHLGADYPHWLEDRLADLDAGDIETLVHTIETLLPDLPEPIATATGKALPYFTGNAHRMRYAHFRDQGLFIGSGVIEAGCKTIVGARLKQSGMRWNIPGAGAILTLRCHQASGRTDHIWAPPHNQRPTPASA